MVSSLSRAARGAPGSGDAEATELATRERARGLTPTDRALDCDVHNIVNTVYRIAMLSAMTQMMSGRGRSP
jgi:hypothetical protein